MKCLYRSGLPETIYDVLDFVILIQHGVLNPRVPRPMERYLLPATRFKNRRTLCLDMDDTLTLMVPDGCSFHNGDKPKVDPDTVVFSHENPDERGLVYIRPYLRTFLEAVSRMFEVVVFTAACREYADQILDFIDPDNILFHHRLYRESCVECVPDPGSPDAKVYIKDLRLLGRDLSDVVLVDNSLQCFAYQLDNGILCNPFKGDPADTELISILEILSIVERKPQTDVSRIFQKMYGVSRVLQEYKSKGGRQGLNKDPNHSSDNMTPHKPKPLVPSAEVSEGPYPSSVQPKGSREREIWDSRENYQRRGSHKPTAGTSDKRRPSLVPSVRFRASLGGG